MKILLKNKNKIISNDSKVAEEFSSFLKMQLNALNIEPHNTVIGNTANLSDPVETAIKKMKIIQVLR